MEARTIRTILIMTALMALMLEFVSGNAVLRAQTRGYQASSTNFVVVAPDPNLAQKAAHLAEKYRRELAIDWLGYELKTWKQKCPIKIEIGPHAGGETSFAFVEGRRSEPTAWQMKIYGPLDRVLDAVLPHEVTHTIFATHFGCPLPRWADEGACTTVEHSSERKKNHRMLLEFLTATPSRGIPFNRMFTMKRYPHDILPLYAQGYSLARFLIGQKGRRHFVKYLEHGIELERPENTTKVWDQVTSQWYGYRDLSELQVEWLTWVRKGSPDFTASDTIALAKNEAISPERLQQTFANQPARSAKDIIATNPLRQRARPATTESWYVRQSAHADKMNTRGFNDTTDKLISVRANTKTSHTPPHAPAFRPGSVGRFNERKTSKDNSNTSFKYDANLNRTIWR